MKTHTSCLSIISPPIRHGLTRSRRLRTQHRLQRHLLVPAHLRRLRPELTQMPLPAITQDSDNPMSRPHLQRRADGRYTIHSTTTPNKQALLLNQIPRHRHRLPIPNPHSTAHQRTPSLKVRRHPVDADALHDRIHLAAAPRAFALPGVKHHAVRHTVEQAAALGVREHDAQPRQPRDEVAGDAAQRASRAGARDEGVEHAAALRVDLGPGAVVVRAPVGGVLELVGEEATAGGERGGGVGGGEAPREVDEVVWVDDGGGGNEGYGCAEGEEEGGFFGGLVVGHAAGGVGR